VRTDRKRCRRAAMLDDDSTHNRGSPVCPAPSCSVPVSSAKQVGGKAKMAVEMKDFSPIASKQPVLAGPRNKKAKIPGNKKAQHRCWAFLSLIYKVILVGVRGFEPPASTSRRMRTARVSAYLKGLKPIIGAVLQSVLHCYMWEKTKVSLPGDASFSGASLLISPPTH
jgi:hypothetical protein